MRYQYMNLVSWQIVICSLVGGIASGQLASAQVPNERGIPLDIVLMGIGGWGSCSEGKTPDTQHIAPQVKDLKRKLERQLPPQYFNVQIVFVCSPYPLRSANGGRMMDYKILQSTQAFVNGPTRTRSQSGRIAEQNVVSLLNIIQKRFHNPLTYVFGHSHGGYSAMKAVASSPFQIKGLYTLEPIDNVACNTREFLRNQLGTIPVPACRQSPRMNGNRYDRIAAKADDNWHNFTFRHRRGADNGKLYSSVIPGRFTKEHVLGIHFGADTHHRLGAHRTTWSKIVRDVSKNVEGHSSLD